MNLRQYLIVLTLGTAVALSSWFIVLLAIDPVHASTLAFLAFYVTMMSGLAGLLTIIGTVARARKYTDEQVGLVVARSLRQGVLLTLLVGGSMALLSRGAFTPLSAILLIALVAVVEFLFLSLNRSEV
ncbi:MAG: hypothetical protein NUV56_03540 [Candidatus Uhrbacteria bacterium]|nr:hypothetical protein [Candidatus Uhrbacteria bacterium]